MAYSPSPSLLALATSGNRAATDELLRDIRPLVERQLLRYPVSDQDREDLLQATLMQVVRRLESFRGDASFSTWLFRVTANEALMLMRSQRRLKARVRSGVEDDELARIAERQPAEADDAETRIGKLERDRVVAEAIDALPSDYRDVVTAHYMRELGLHEIARSLQVTESAVRSRLHRARARLRDALQPAYASAPAFG